MLNQVILVGRSNSNIDVQTARDGRRFAYVNLSVERTFKNMAGVYDTDVIPICIWDGLVTACEKELKVGTLVAVKARIEKLDSQMTIVAERISYLSKPEVE